MPPLKVTSPGKAAKRSRPERQQPPPLADGVPYADDDSMGPMGGAFAPSPAVPFLSDDVLIRFGVTDPAQRRKLSDWLKFAHGLGCDGTRQSVETIVRCMNNAVDIYHQFQQRSEYMQLEINRMFDDNIRKDREKTALQTSKDDALAKMLREHEVLVLTMQDQFKTDMDGAEDQHRVTEQRLETDLINLNDELQQMQRDHTTAMEAAAAEVRTLTTRVVQLELENEALQLQGDNAALQEALTLMTAERDGMAERLQRIDALSSNRQGLLYDRIALDAASCPVFLGTGCVIGMRSLIRMWAQGPGLFDGEAHRAVTCPRTLEQTFVAPRAQVDFVRDMAEAVGVDVAVPLRFEFTKPPRGEWTEFILHDQIALASRVCKIYRRRSIEAGDFVIAGLGTLKVVFALGETLLEIPDEDGTRFRPKLSFHVQSLMGDANAVMRGRVVVAADWNPFPYMDVV